MSKDLDTLRPEVREAMNKQALTAEYAREIFSYNADTGELRWRIAPSSRTNIGDIAGSYDRKGYLRVAVRSKHYLVHRVVWLIVTGKWPNNQIDHINGVHADNRWLNLRDATNAENQQNAKLRCTNTSGFRGVSWFARDSKWRAQIKHKGATSTLGYFDTPEEAHAVYLEAKSRLHVFQPVPRECVNG